MTELKLTIKRVSYLPEGTFGVILADNIPFALTAELPNLNNQKEISCIPEGSYACERYASQKFGNTLRVVNVPNREGILFHKGNIPQKDSKGCILIGEQFETVNGKINVLSSAKGFEEFIKYVTDKLVIRLEIKSSS